MGGIWVLYRVLSKDFLDLIDDISVARGLITFMVAMITVTLAIVLSMYPIVSPGNKTEVEKADMKERFMLAKEVLMVFVGILGTIVGFYYASNHTGGAEALVPGLFFEPSDEVQSGEKVTLLSFMTTGTPPYKYEVSSDPKGIDKSGEDLDKFINVHVATPTGVLEDSIYTITLTITDSTGIKIPELQKQLKVRKRTSAALPVEPTPPLSIKLSTVEAGKNFTLEGNVGPESAYEITTDPPLKIGPSGSASVPPTKSDTGQVKAEFTVPPDSSPGPYKLTITVTDKAGTAKTFTMDLTVNSPSQPAG